MANTFSELRECRLGMDRLVPDNRLNVFRNVANAIVDFIEGLGEATGTIVGKAKRENRIAKIAREEASTDDPERQFYFGCKYETGQAGAGDYNVAQDYKQALHFFQKAAERGHTGAQSKLGLLHYYGRGTARDFQPALFWFKKAAERGHSDAQFDLAVLYGNGQGVTEDYKQSQYWLEKSSAQGNEMAKVLLAALRDEGTEEWIRQLRWWGGPPDRELTKNSETSIVECPVCHQKLKVPTGRHVQITCSRCSNIFEIDLLS